MGAKFNSKNHLKKTFFRFLCKSANMTPQFFSSEIIKERMQIELLTKSDRKIEFFTFISNSISCL
jgi:hypothetical protein